MSNSYLDKVIETIPRFAERISLFTRKIRLAQYADGSIYDYRIKISQAILYLKKLPNDMGLKVPGGLVLPRVRKTKTYTYYYTYYYCCPIKNKNGEFRFISC